MIPRGAMHLLYQATRATFIAEEKNSWLGVLWHLAHPLAFTLVLFVVFSRIPRFAEIEHYPLFILIGILHFNFFANATTRAVNAMRLERDFVLNSTAPLEILVLRSVAVEVLHYCIDLALAVALIAAFAPGTLTWSVLAYPLVLAAAVGLTAGAAFFLAALVPFLSDVVHIWTIAARMLFFLTPIFYSLENLPAPEVRGVLALNPLTGLVGAARDVLLAGRLPAIHPGALLLVPAVTLLLGWTLFARLKRTIPDYV
jgi:lipopolysaccharide transport system permease protein